MPASLVIVLCPSVAGKEAEQLAKRLGAGIYLDSAATDAAAELQKMGGVQVILTTVPSAKPMTALFPGLGPRGKMVVVGATMDPLEVSPGQLIQGSGGIQGWAAGIPTDSEDTLRFAEMAGVRPMIEKYPLEWVNEAFSAGGGGKAQFRVVLTMLEGM